jgi:hypothetical protein
MLFLEIERALCRAPLEPWRCVASSLVFSRFHRRPSLAWLRWGDGLQCALVPFISCSLELFARW